VRYTVLDALQQGFGVTVLTDAIRAVDVTPGDGDRALDEMRSAGATLATASAVFAGNE
jgi:nicotinamidase/pyrazinamidase